MIARRLVKLVGSAGVLILLISAPAGAANEPGADTAGRLPSDQADTRVDLNSALLRNLQEASNKSTGQILAARRATRGAFKTWQDVIECFDARDYFIRAACRLTIDGRTVEELMQADSQAVPGMDAWSPTPRDQWYLDVNQCSDAYLISRTGARIGRVIIAARNRQGRFTSPNELRSLFPEESDWRKVAPHLMIDRVPLSEWGKTAHADFQTLGQGHQFWVGLVLLALLIGGGWFVSRRRLSYRVKLSLGFILILVLGLTLLTVRLGTLVEQRLLESMAEAATRQAMVFADANAQWFARTLKRRGGQFLMEQRLRQMSPVAQSLLYFTIESCEGERLATILFPSADTATTGIIQRGLAADTLPLGTTFIEDDGQPCILDIGLVVPIKDQNLNTYYWRAHTGVDVRPVHLAIRRLYRNVAFGTFICLTAGIIAILLVSQRATRPLGALRGAMAAVRGGDLQAQAVIRSRDEFAALGEDFNRMVAGLREKQRMRGIFETYVSGELVEAVLRGEDPTGFIPAARAEITVLFSDLHGFTNWSTRTDPREVMATLNDLFPRLIAAVQAEGGVLDKLIGDALMVHFGTPLKPLTDDARCAVRAAIVMQRAVEEFNRERESRGKPRLDMGIGLAHGTVVAGSVGSAERKEYTVIGNEVNLASRLCGKAAQREIVISEWVQLRLDDSFKTEEMETLTVKEIDTPIRAFRVLWS